MELRAVCLLLGLHSVLAQKEEFVETGGAVTLRPDVSEALTSILWKHKGNLAAEWVKGVVPLTYYPAFRGRTTLNTDDGHLEIKDINANYSGSYTAEINTKLPGQSFTVRVIKAVPKPEVWIRPEVCNHASEMCTLTCDGKPDEAKPVTYSWKYGDGEWKESTVTVDITKTETEQFKTFSCRMKNPVSQKDSEAKDNPFYSEPLSAGAIVGIVVVVVLLIGGLAGAYFKRDAIRSRISTLRGHNNTGQAPVNGSTSPTPTSNLPEETPLTPSENATADGAV